MPEQALTDEQVELRRKVYKITQALGFAWRRRNDWYVWAARLQECPYCGQLPHKPCINMSQAKLGHTIPTKWPHESRIDWQKLVDGLIERGYWDGKTEI